jgi:hypothetical protein
MRMHKRRGNREEFGMYAHMRACDVTCTLILGSTFVQQPTHARTSFDNQMHVHWRRYKFLVCNVIFNVTPTKSIYRIEIHVAAASKTKSFSTEKSLSLEKSLHEDHSVLSVDIACRRRCRFSCFFLPLRLLRFPLRVLLCVWSLMSSSMSSPSLGGIVGVLGEGTEGGIAGVSRSVS